MKDNAGGVRYDMGDKSVQKKQFIVETAKKVFMEKGYKNVTMKDIVEACDISRGGLYLYFDSTKVLFEAVLQLEGQETDDVFSESIAEDATAADILALFLKEQKKELLRKKDNLTIAIYEFFFEVKVPKKDNYLRNQFYTAVEIIKHLIEEGVESGEFHCENPEGAARNIMFVIEGLKITSQTIGITEKTVNQELLYIMEGLVAEA